MKPGGWRQSQREEGPGCGCPTSTDSWTKGLNHSLLSPEPSLASRGQGSRPGPPKARSANRPLLNHSDPGPALNSQDLLAELVPSREAAMAGVMMLAQLGGSGLGGGEAPQHKQ